MGENHLIKALKAGASHSKSKKFGVNRHCAKSDLMFLSCDVTSHNHFFKRLDDFMAAPQAMWYRRENVFNLSHDLKKSSLKDCLALQIETSDNKLPLC